MSGSSENDGGWPMSSKKRKCRFKRSGLSSSSDESPNHKINNRTFKSPRKEVNMNSKGATGLLQSPRSSERLRQKHAKSFTLPSRKKTLEEVSPGVNHLSQKKAKSLKPRRLVNNFIRERSSYVSRGDNDFASDDSGMSDFINDDEEEEEEEQEEEEEEEIIKGKELSDGSTDNFMDSRFGAQKNLKKEKHKMSVVSSSDEEEQEEKQNEDEEKMKEKELSGSSDNFKDSGFGAQKNMKKKTPKKRVLSSSDECAGKDSNDIPSPKTINKKSTLSRVTGSSSDSEKGFTQKCQNYRKQRKVIEQSETSSGEDKTSFTTKKKLNSTVVMKNSDGSESDKASKKSSLESRPTPLRSRSKRLLHLSSKQEQKNNKFHALLKQRQYAKLEPKERIAKKQKVWGNSDDSFNSDSRSSGTEYTADACTKAEACFFQNSSDLEEDDDDRDFIVSNGETSDEELNSDGVSQFLKLLDTFTHKHLEEDANYPKDVQQNGDDFVLTRRRRQRRKKRKERQPSKWRRIKMEEDSENEDSDTIKYNVNCKKQLLIHAAVLEDDIDLAKKLLRENPDCICDMDYEKRTALHLAALKGKEDFVKLLLEHGADCTALDYYGLPAIAYALDGHLECVKALLDFSIIKHISNSMRNNAQKMNLLHFAIGESRGGMGHHSRALCLELLFSKDKKMLTKMLEDKDARGFTPLVAAVHSGQYECVKVLLKLGANVLAFKTAEGGNILHFAVESASRLRKFWEADKDTTQALRILLHTSGTRSLIDQADELGFTPLMYACETGHPGCVSALLEDGASLECEDSHGTSSLHLASMSGNTQCVQLLLNYGHEVDCLDKYGWPPLLYANFKAHESCVLALMKPKPEQVFVLGDLLRGAKNETQKRRAVRVVKNVLVSLANHDAYYTVFNDFIRANPEMLDDNNYGLLQHTWRAILDFDNKRRWFTRKLAEVREQQRGMHFTVALEVDRENVLGTVMEKIGKTLGHALRKMSLSVTFKNEPGICTGPKREFFACLCKDVVDPKHGLFAVTDDSQYSPIPNAYFAKYMESDSQFQQQSLLQQQTQESSQILQPVGREDVEGQPQSEANPVIQCGETLQSLTPDESNRKNNSLSNVEVPEGITWISCMDQESCDRSVVNLSLRRKLKQLRFIGRMVGLAICENILLDLHLSKPFVKQVLGIALSHPDDLNSFDHELHKNAVIWVQENSVDELELPFSVDTMNPWNSQPVTVKLSDDTEKKVTDKNKDEYVKLVSQFKLETSIRQEIEDFSGGLHEVVPREILSLFTADEFSLLIGGVTRIDVQDWKKNTLYDCCSVEDNVIIWFWNVVSQLKEEEKALLMQFSTGSPCVPLGGFASLTGLGGPTRFTILKIGGIDKIPMASTCFNMLKLTSYSSEKQLREKLLIAIRHGAEGFSFA